MARPNLEILLDGLDSEHLTLFLLRIFVLGAVTRPAFCQDSIARLQSVFSCHLASSGRALLLVRARESSLSERPAPPMAFRTKVARSHVKMNAFYRVHYGHQLKEHSRRAG